MNFHYGWQLFTFPRFGWQSDIEKYRGFHLNLATAMTRVVYSPLRGGRTGLGSLRAGVTIVVLVLTTLVSGLTAQTVRNQTGNSRVAFEVASIRPDKSTGRPTSDFPIGPGRVYAPRGGVFRASHILPIQYISFAYKLTHSQMAYLSDHVPDWIRSEGFDITASVEGVQSEDQLRLMMQSLLEDRFKLKISKQNREIQTLALVLAKPGTTATSLRPHSPEPPCPKRGPSAEEQETVPGGFPISCHGIVMLPPSAPGRDRLGARDVTLSFIADALSGSAVANVDRPLIDMTGLTGTFDFTLECAPELEGTASPNETAAREPSGPPFRQALQEQLGIKLVPQKSIVEMFVIDHVEHPTEN